MTRQTQAQLAKTLECSAKTISKHLAQQDAPQPDKLGRYDAAAVRDYVNTRRLLNNDMPTSKSLLEAKIRKLDLESQELRGRMKEGLPAFDPEDVENVLWLFLAEARAAHVGRIVNDTAALLVNVSDVHMVRAILSDALITAEDQIGRWCEENGLNVNGLRVDWPLPHPAFASWRKGKQPKSEQKPNERKESDNEA